MERAGQNMAAVLDASLGVWISDHATKFDDMIQGRARSHHRYTHAHAHTHTNLTMSCMAPTSTARQAVLCRMVT